MNKQRLHCLVAVACFSLLVSCESSKLEIEISHVKSGEVELSLSATSEEGTKVTFTEEDNARWENSDHIAVFDGTGKRDFTIKSGTNTGTSALFSGTVANSYSNLYTVYPYSAAGSLSGSNVTVTVPSEQTVSSSNRVAPSAIVSVGKVNTSNMTVEFKQVCGLVSFTIASNDIFKVIIEGSNIAGTATVAAATGVTSSVSSGSDKITVSYSGGGNFATGKYYVAVLPGTTTAGNFAVSFVHEDGITHYKAVSKAVTIERNGRKAAGTVTVENPKVRRIYNKAQLDAWGEGMADDEQYFTVYLEKDIDYASGTWSHTNTHFNGNFLGQNHKIYNIIVESATKTGFIYELWGDVSNVVFGSSNGTSYDGVSRITHKGNKGAIEYVGLFSTIQASGTDLVNVVNFAPVSVPSGSYSTRAFIGGLAGFIASGKTPTITNCENYGNITNNSTYTENPAQIGGIVGQCLGSPTASGLKNYGNLTINTGASFIIGGLFGSLDSGSSLSNSENHGNITIANSGSSELHAGGCVGVVYGSTLSSCHNYGTVTTNRNAANYVGGIVGRLMSGTISLTSCTNHTDANISVGSSVTTRSFMGGIAGCYIGSGEISITISGCKNEAAVTNNGGASEVGGVVGIFDSTYATAHTLKITGCENTGTVSSTVTDNGLSSLGRELRIGGILGMANNEANTGLCSIVVEDCINRGKVSVAGALTTGQSLRVGGIVGHSFYDVLIDSCKNSGEITCPVAGSGAGGAVLNMGGILGYFKSRSSSRYQRITSCINIGNITTTRNVGSQYLGGILGSGDNSDAFPHISSSENYGAISTVRTSNSQLGGIAGYTCFVLTDNSTYGNVGGGQYNGAVYGDNNGKSSSSGTKVGNGVKVNGVSAPAIGSYSYGTGSQTGKDWFVGWNGNSAITVSVVTQKSAPSF